MKELDKTKKYDLSKLTDEQLNELCNKKNKLNLSDYFKDVSELIYDVRYSDWIVLGFNKTSNLWYINDRTKVKPTNCATELFEDEKGNVVTQYDRMMINEINKPMTEEEKELISLFNTLSDYKDYKFKVQYSIIELEKELSFSKGKKRKNNIYKQFLKRLNKI